MEGIVYAIASLSQVGVGYLIDRYSPKIILGFVGIGQFFLIYLSSLYIDYALFFVMLMAMFLFLVKCQLLTQFLWDMLMISGEQEYYQ